MLKRYCTKLNCSKKKTIKVYFVIALKFFYRDGETLGEAIQSKMNQKEKSKRGKDKKRR
jgi:hypothetical protein